MLTERLSEVTRYGPADFERVWNENNLAEFDDSTIVEVKDAASMGILFDQPGIDIPT